MNDSILKVTTDGLFFELNLINHFEDGEKESVLSIQFSIDGLFRGVFRFQKNIYYPERKVEYFIPFDCYGGDLLVFTNELKKVKNDELEECILSSGNYDSFFLKIKCGDKGFGKMILSAEFNFSIINLQVTGKGQPTTLGNKFIVYGYEFNQSYLEELIRNLEEYLEFAKIMGVNMARPPN